METVEIVRSIVSKRLNVELAEVVPEARFVEDLGADSLAIVELVVALEKQFGITIPNAEANKISCVGDALEYVVTRTT